MYTPLVEVAAVKAALCALLASPHSVIMNFRGPVCRIGCTTVVGGISSSSLVALVAHTALDASPLCMSAKAHDDACKGQGSW